MTDQEIIAEVQKAVALHRDSKHNLEKRMIELLNEVPDNVIEIANHKIVYRDVYQYCSQWSNVRGSLHPETAYVIDGKYTIGTPDASYWDGHNMQHADTSETFSSRRIPESIDDVMENGDLAEAPSSMLREIAKQLPTFLIQYIARMTDSAAENSEVTESLPKGE